MIYVFFSNWVVYVRSWIINQFLYIYTSKRVYRTFFSLPIIVTYTCNNVAKHLNTTAFPKCHKKVMSFLWLPIRFYLERVLDLARMAKRECHYKFICKTIIKKLNWNNKKYHLFKNAYIKC